MKRTMIFSSLNHRCDDFIVTKEEGEGYAENSKCWLRSNYKNREDFQTKLDDMCRKCIEYTSIFKLYYR